MPYSNSQSSGISFGERFWQTNNGFHLKALESYSKAKECTLSQDRMHATLLLRHFLHKKKYYLDGATAPFWSEFRSFWEEIEKDGRPQKWERLEEIDKRRVERARGTNIPFF